MRIQQYINENFKGCKAAFARAFGRSRAHVGLMLKKADKWYIVRVDGKDKLMQEKAERISE